jgi:hypothetical protein
MRAKGRGVGEGGGVRGRPSSFRESGLSLIATSDCSLCSVLWWYTLNKLPSASEELGLDVAVARFNLPGAVCTRA